jgi:hypothetical protein
MSKPFRYLLLFLLSISGVLIYKPPLYDVLLTVTMFYWFVVRGFGINSRLLPPAAFLLLYVGFYWLSVTRATEISSSLWYASLTTFCAAMWLFYTNVLSRYGMPAFHTIMLGCSITALVGVTFGFIVFTSNFAGRELLLYNDRPKGLYTDANVFGPSLVMVLLYALCRLILAERFDRKTLYWTLVALVTSAGVFSSFSRGAWVNAAVSVVMLLVLMIASTRGVAHLFKRTAILMLGLCICGGALYYSFADRGEFADVARSRSKLQTYDEERFASHANALEQGMEHPLLGIGPAQYIPMFHIAPHSLPLHIFSENGAIALLGLAGFLFLTCVRSAMQIRSAQSADIRIYFCAITALLLAQMVNSAVIDTLHWRHMWLLCAFAWMSPARIAVRAPLPKPHLALAAIARLQTALRYASTAIGAES